MNTEVTLPFILTEDRKQSVKSSASIVGMNRTTFIRNYLQTGKISKATDENGKDYIDISELVRVFGLEKIMQGLREHNELVQNVGNEQEATLNKIHEHNGLFMDLKIENATLKAELQGLKTLLEERQTRIQEKERLIQQQQDGLIKMQYLLENWNKEKPLKNEKKSLIDKIKSIFIG